VSKQTQSEVLPIAQYQCSVDRDMVQAFFRDKDAAVGLLEAVLNEYLKLETTEQVQAEPYERTDSRQCYRNGYRTRRLMTRVGPIELEVPRLRNGQFSTELFDRYQRSEQALVLAMMEMVVNGVSTRKVRRITEELCGTSFSRSTVSTLCRRLNELVKMWNEGDLSGQSFSFIVLEAQSTSGRQGGIPERIAGSGSERQRSPPHSRHQGGETANLRPVGRSTWSG